MGNHVVIVGGGLGGLSAGVACAQAGCRVTLLEKQPATGGYACTFERKGFTFDPSLHATVGGESGGPFDRAVRALGVEREISFIKVEKGFFARIGSSTFQIPTDYTALLDELSAAFPSQRKGLGRLCAHICRLAPLYYDTVEGALSPFEIATRFVPKAPLFLRHAGISTNAYLSSFIDNPTLAALLYHPAVFYGIEMRRFPAVNFMLMFYLLFVKGMYTIRGGGGALSKALARRLASLGGTIVTGAEVKSLKMARGRVTAAITAGGDEFAADGVICNVNTPASVHSLAGDGFFPKSYVRALRSLRPSLSLLQLHLGLDCALSETGIQSRMTTIFPNPDFDAVFDPKTQGLLPKAFSIIAPGLDDVSMAPQGKSVLSVLGGVSPDAWMALSADDYREAKQRCASDLLKKLDKLYPKIMPHCSVVDCATPLTFARYSGNPRGAILGFDCSLGSHRTIMKISRPPIRNLYFANAWTSRLGGYLQVVKAGIAAATRYARDIG